MDRCVVCENEVDDHGECMSNSFIGHFGYGSTLDSTKIHFYICDDCAKEKIEKGIIADCGEITFI